MSITGGLMLAGSLASGAFSYAGASKQASAANKALTVEQQNQQEAVGDVNQEWTTQQANEAPFLNAGSTATLDLSSLLSTPGEGLLAEYPGGPFTAPTMAQAEADPGYQFALSEGEKGVANSAAAQGELLDPNAINAQDQFAQNLATTQYGNVYNRALSTYGTNLNAWQLQQQQDYSRLLGLAGIGSTAAGQLGQEGSQYGSTIGNILLGGAQQQAQQINNAAAAQAAGLTSVGNTIGGTLNNMGSMLMLSNLLSPQSPSADIGGTFNGGSVGGVSDPALATPGYMPGSVAPESLMPPSVSGITIPA